MSILTNIRKRGLRDVLNPTKWLVFISSKVRAASGHDLDEEIAWAEQLVFRRSRCAGCVAAGECQSCGCPIKEAMSERANKCSAHQWGVALNAPDWEEYKKRYDIKIIVT